MFGELVGLDVDLGLDKVAESAAAAIPDAISQGTSYVPDYSSLFSFGVDKGSGSSGLRLAAESVAPAASAATPSAGGGGWGDWLKSWVSPIGDVAKAVLPIAAIGAAGLGVKNAMGARDRLDRTEPVIREAQKTQLEAARTGQELAPAAAALSPQVAAVAPRQGELAQIVQTAVAPRQAERAATIDRTIAAPSVDYATQLLASARAGQLPASYESEIDLWKQGALQKARDYLARSGQGDSSAMVTWENYIEGQASTMRAERLRQIEDTALKMLGMGRESYGTAGSLTESESRIYGTAGNLNESEARILQGAAQPIGVAGNVLAGSAGAAQAAGNSAIREEEDIESLIARANAQLFNLASRPA